MPLYEYRCPICDRTVEVLQRYGDDKPPQCDRHFAVMVKQVSAGSFRLKGSGWHATDYK